ncbi:MAG: hypothetical protein GY950_32130 [bacterium]|nr:hypothetical protein [bacterium]
MQTVNDQLLAAGENFQLTMVECYTNMLEDGVEAGTIVYFNDHTLRLDQEWIPGDPRRGGFYDIAWLSDQVQGDANPLSLADTQAAVDRGMAKWDSVKCADIPLTKLPDYGIDWGYVQYLMGWGGVPGWLADITQAGWMPSAFFEALYGPNSGVIAVTFSFTWIEDLNLNDKPDMAFAEVYYNSYYAWGIDTDNPLDTETIVMHENGHALGLGHFGKAFRTPNGKLHFAPRALMNAGYGGKYQKIKGTDNGAFCGIWASWPNN